MLQASAPEVILEFPLNIPGQWPALLGQAGYKGGVIFINELVQESLFRAVTFVLQRTLARPVFPACRQLPHDRVLAIGDFYSG